MRGVLAGGLAVALFGLAMPANAAPEHVYVLSVSAAGNSVLVARENRQIWVIDLGAGCPALWLYKRKWVVLDSSGMFAGIGSDLILAADDQRCPVWNGRQM